MMRIYPVRAAVAARLDRSGGGFGFPFCKAGFGGVSLVRDSTESVFDWQLVDLVGIVVIEPLLRLGMVGMLGIGCRIERLVEARYAAAILRWSISFAGEALSE
jgi:hypothetical protein